jgi:hypothetical protein
MDVRDVLGLNSGGGGAGGGAAASSSSSSSHAAAPGSLTSPHRNATHHHPAGSPTGHGHGHPSSAGSSTPALPRELAQLRSELGWGGGDVLAPSFFDEKITKEKAMKSKRSQHRPEDCSRRTYPSRMNSLLLVLLACLLSASRLLALCQ